MNPFRGMHPNPPRQPMIECAHCQVKNDPARGSRLCRSCRKPLDGSQ